jgi:hypothetical protein
MIVKARRLAMEIAVALTLLVLSVIGASCMITSIAMIFCRGGWHEVMTKPRREGKRNSAIVLMITGAAIGVLLFSGIVVASQFFPMEQIH